MKLPPTIAETGAFHTQGRQVNTTAGRATSGDDRHGFDDVLSNLGAKANGAGSSATSTGKPAAARQATGTAVASAQGTQEVGPPDAAKDAPTFFDALLAGSSRATPEPADPRTSTTAGAASQDDEMVDSVLKRVSRRGYDAPAATPAATSPQNPAALLSLVVPAVGAQANGSKSSPGHESTPTSMPAVAPDGSDKVASAATQPIGKADAQPLTFDIAVASQLAPATAVSWKGNTGATPTAPDPAVANASAAKGPSSPTPAGALSGAPAAATTAPAHAADLTPDEAHATGGLAPRRSTTRPSNPATPSDVGTAADPAGDGGIGRAGTTAAGHAQAQEKPSAVSSSATASSSPAEQPVQQVIETDPETPRKEEAATSLDGTSAASGEMLASATSTLSPPVRQVAAALARLAADAPASPGAATDATTDATKLRPTLARTLTLQMSPAALGTVSVRMHSSGGALDVQLSASDPQTAGLLVRERDALATSLQGSHTTLHSLVIQDGSGAPQPGGQHATQGDTSGAGTRADRQGSDAGSQGDGRQQRQRPDSEQRRENAPGGDRRGPQARPDGDRRSLLV